ncbi:MAG: hypothetical protein K2X91_14825, partial [Thermoleophilia bacterium]|nr:hypothetical protein [Thermoleophilia bacterium]
MDLVGLLARDAVIGRIAERALRARRAAVLGSAGSSPTLFAGALSRVALRPVALVFAHTDEADEAYDELCSAGVAAARLPALETLPGEGESSVSLDALAERLATVRALERWSAEPSQSDKPHVFVTTISALMQGVPAPSRIDAVLRVVRAGEEVKGGPAALVRWLDAAGYTRVESVEEPGQFAARGGILDVFPPGDPGASSAQGAAEASLGGVPVRLDFFGDQVDKIVEVDPRTMAADRTVRSVQLVAAAPQAVQSDAGTVNAGTLLPSASIVVLNEVLELTEQGRGYFERLINSA